MNQRPNDSGPGRFFRGWRREIVRGAVLFAAVLAAGLLAIPFLRSFAAGWPDFHEGDGFGVSENREWHETFLFASRLKPGDKVWIRNRSGAVVVAAAPGESLHVVAEKSWRRSSPEMVEVVAVPHEGGVTICALWEAQASRCRPRGDYEVSNPRRGDVMVRFMVHVPRGVSVDASTINGVLEISGVEGGVVANTVNGKLDAHVVRGPFSGRTVNGAIDATLAVPARGGPGDISLATVNGTITAALAPGLDGELEASTVNGRIDTEYPVAVSGKLTSRRLKGRLGKGGRKVEFSAVNGSIRLVELGEHEEHEKHEVHEAHLVPPAPPAPEAVPAPKVRVRVRP